MGRGGGYGAYPGTSRVIAREERDKIPDTSNHIHTEIYPNISRDIKTFLEIFRHILDYERTPDINKV